MCLIHDGKNAKTRNASSTHTEISLKILAEVGVFRAEILRVEATEVGSRSLDAEPMETRAIIRIDSVQISILNLLWRSRS